MTPPGAIEMRLAEETLVLLPERAAFRPSDATLYVADLHVGKAASFRSMGVPVPRGTTSSTLDLLDEVLRRTSAQRLVVLGDFLHARSGRQLRTEARVRSWRVEHPTLEITLVRGNHDLHAGDPDPALDITIHDAPYRDGTLTLHHAPPADASSAWLAGHIHPGVRLAGRARERLFLPCFHQQHAGLVLPAFGAFTGLSAITPGLADRVFAVAGDRVIEVRPHQPSLRPILPDPADS